MRYAYQNDKNNMQQAHLFISGLVQGIGYRQFVKQKARKKGLFGWVRNLPDGRVEAVLQGEKTAIDTLITICRRGPFLAEVQDVQIVWEEGKEEYKEFSVVIPDLIRDLGFKKEIADRSPQ